MALVESSRSAAERGRTEPFDDARAEVGWKTRVPPRRLFVGAYRWFALAGADGELMLATFHDHLASLFDPQNYHSQFVSATHGDRFSRAPVDLATDRAAKG